MERRPGRGPRPRSRGRGAVLLCGVCGVLLLLSAWGCGSGADDSGDRGDRGDRGREAARKNPAAEAEWAWLQRTKTELDGQRARLAAGPADPRLAQQARTLGDEFDRRLIALLNADPPVQGEPLTRRQQDALRLKSDEDIHLAHTFIEAGGDYQRAIDIYKQALAIDPGNPRLREELARAQARRYMTRPAFAQVQKGMDPEAVRGLLGQPNLNNVRSYPERGVVGWFYPKDASGAAAAVWFHKEDGRLTVYLADFDAVQPPAAPPRPPAPPATRSST